MKLWNVIATVFGAVASVILAVIMFVWFAGIVVLLFLYWMFGGVITIKRDDKVVGTLRWFTYTTSVT